MKKIFVLILAVTLLAVSMAGCTGKPKLSPKDPVTLTMWHVYGSQTESPLNDVIHEFNQTEGKERGITVTVTSVTDSSAIDETLVASANGEPGSAALPDLFTAYPRVAEKIGTDRLLDWSGSFSEEELSAYVEDFLAEGYLNGRLLMLPIAKSTELLFLNRTLFDRFSADTGADADALSDFDSLFSTCEQYCDWTDGQTMFQINDFYHYFLVSIQSLGGEFIRDGKPDCGSTEFEAVYTPMAHAAIYGGVCVGEGYASDRWKTGEIISNIGSSAGMLYLRSDVTYEDNTTEPIEIEVYPYPTFSGAAPVVLQRGTGLFAVRSEDERKNEAAAVFAKWLTEEQHNLDFVTNAGYLPVTHAAFESLMDNTRSVENEKYRALYEAVGSMYGSYSFCKLPVYEHSGDIQTAFEKTVKAVLSDAHNEYVCRVSAGEDEQAVLSELLDAALEEIRANIG